MKRLIFKFALLALLLVVMNWIYTKFFFHSDLLKYSDEITLSWDVAKDSCVIVYTGESSNHTFSSTDKDKSKISTFFGRYYPDIKCGDMTKNASHAEVYYYLLKHIPEDAPVKTVIITMNLRSFNTGWINSDLETPIQKQLVLLKDNPPLLNRFKLAFKDYDIKTNEERRKQMMRDFANDILVFPYDFEYHNISSWDYAMANKGIKNPNGTKNWKLTELACHFIKSYAFQIHDDNPRIKDFDSIVNLAKERNWTLIFNLLAENVDRANELVGKELIFLIKQNRDYLIHRYGNLDNVILVDNISEVRNGLFTDQNWTTEHYFEAGRRTIAHNLALSAIKFYPNSFVELNDIQFDNNHFRIDSNLDSIKIDVSNPYGCIIKKMTSGIDTTCTKIYLSAKIKKSTNCNANLVMETRTNDEKTSYRMFHINGLSDYFNQWDFICITIPIDTTFFRNDEFRLYFFNNGEAPLYVKSLDISFEKEIYGNDNKLMK